jgi:membrane protease YdiL (CAAX protease family)
MRDPTNEVARAPDRKRALRQLTISYLATTAFVFALSRKTPMQYGLHELIGALFLIAALASVRRDDDDTARYGVRLGGIFPGKTGDDRSLVRAIVEGIPRALGELGIATGVALVVLPVYAFFWPMFNHAPAARHFTLDGARMKEILTNLLAVALTEEMYFRGYLQTRMGDAFGVSRAPSPPPSEPKRESAPEAAVEAQPVHRASIAEEAGSRDAVFARLKAMALPIVITSALFAITHVTVEVTIQRAVVFFPGLLFGFVREWRKGIGAAVFLHAISNVFELWLEGR